MSDTPDRNDEAPHNAPTAPRGDAQVAGRGHLFDTAFYQSWAIDADGTWRYLPVDADPDAAAEFAGQTWRALVKAGALHCPYPGCTATFSGVRKGAGRVAFVHPKTEATHTDKAAKQAMWRLAGAATVQRWAQQAYPGSTVTTADIDLTPTPDVLISTTDGDRVAVHLLADKLSDADWRSQADAHRVAGVAAVWLVANTGAFAKKAPGTEQYRPATPVPAALADGATIGWLNPFLGLVGQADAGTDAAALTVREQPVEAWRPAAAVAAPATAQPADAPAGDVEPTADGASGTKASAERTTAAKPGSAGATTPAAGADAADAAASAAETPTAEAAEPMGTDASAARKQSDASAQPATGKAADAEPEPTESAKRTESAKPAKPTESAKPAKPTESAKPAQSSTPATAADAEPTPADAPVESVPADAADPAVAARSAARPQPVQRSGGWLRRMLDRLRRPAA